MLNWPAGGGESVEKKLVSLIRFTDMMKLNLILAGVRGHTIDVILDQQYTIKNITASDLSILNDRGMSGRQPKHSLATVFTHCS